MTAHDVGPWPIKLMAEYSVGGMLPVWWVGYHEKPTAEELSVSPELIERLRSWQSFFGDHYDHERGWPSEEFLTLHYRDAQILLRELRRELADDSVVLDFWQDFVNGQDRSASLRSRRAEGPDLSG